MTSSDAAGARALAIGLVGRASTAVTEDLIAPAVRSGRVAVYSTPSLAALMEQAAVDCIEGRLAPGEASLGVQVEICHTAVTPLGLTVSATATLTEIEGRKLTFEIEAHDPHGPIGKAVHTRIIVDVARFWSKLTAKTT
ncbi:hotdog domain-containing protein [Hyphomicrobium sp. CS1GBMeth3]|uniref:thioesterase family protein n=1 Tax=Hyphomicrobium sp. CS1GBMeth3 TaxID=1892845 RepID=UPI0009304529|nr:hotdog domain-containing protein [Hyphomicrobium sp. CS1GBMeth3]